MAIANGTGTYDFEAGVSQPLFNRAYDLRLKVAGYEYDMGNSKVYGLRSGADVTTADGVFKVSAEFGNDRLTGQYGQVGAYVNIGFQAENIVKGESPFTKPEPIFRSPRNLRQMGSQKVKRNWRKPSAVIANAKCEGLPDDSLYATPANMACFYSDGGWKICNKSQYVIMANTQGGKTFNTSYIMPYDNQLDGTPYYDSSVTPMWDCASAAYARAASGEIDVYNGGNKWYYCGSVFRRIELPTLQANPSVTIIKIFRGPPGGSTELVDWHEEALPPCP